MIIDTRTQVWHGLDQLGRETADRLRSRTARSEEPPIDASPAAHEREMVCVDGSIVIGFRSDVLGACIPNEYIAEFVSRDPRRRVGVGGIDPMSDDAMDQLDTALGLGLSGIAVSPCGQAFHPAHSEAMRIYERCHENSMPLFVTRPAPLTASARLEFARPALWDEVARLLPDLPIVISQLGYPWVDETLVLLGKHTNVWADISGLASRPWQLYNALLAASSLGVMGKLLFGSGFPLGSPTKTIESLYSVNAFSHGTQLPAVPRSQIRGIVERDAISCLGIDAFISPRSEIEAEPVTTEPMTTEPATTRAPLIETMAGTAVAPSGRPSAAEALADPPGESPSDPERPGHG